MVDINRQYNFVQCEDQDTPFYFNLTFFASYRITKSQNIGFELCADQTSLFVALTPELKPLGKCKYLIEPVHIKMPVFGQRMHGAYTTQQLHITCIHLARVWSCWREEGRTPALDSTKWKSQQNLGEICLKVYWYIFVSKFWVSNGKSRVVSLIVVIFFLATFWPAFSWRVDVNVLFMSVCFFARGLI